MVGLIGIQKETSTNEWSLFGWGLVWQRTVAIYSWLWLCNSTLLYFCSSPLRRIWAQNNGENQLKFIIWNGLWLQNERDNDGLLWWLNSKVAVKECAGTPIEYFINGTPERIELALHVFVDCGGTEDCHPRSSAPIDKKRTFQAITPILIIKSILIRRLFLYPDSSIGQKWY